MMCAWLAVRKSVVTALCRLAAGISVALLPGVSHLSAQPQRTALSAATLAAAPRLRLTAETSFGGEGFFVDFGRMALGDDGRIYAADQRKNQVVVFDSAAAVVAVIDGSGSPGGAFTQPRVMAVARDTLLIMDVDRSDRQRGIRRLNFYTAGGVFLAAYTREDLRNVQRIVATPTGWLMESLVINQSPTRAGEPPVRDTLIIARMGPGGLQQQRVFELPLAERHGLGHGVSRSRRMAAVPSLEVANDGMFYETPGYPYTISVHDEKGSLVHEVVGDVRGVPYTESEFDLWLANTIRDETNPQLVESLRTHGRSIGFAPYRPMITGLHAAPGGYILVRRGDGGADDAAQVRMDVLKDGRPLGHVVMAAEFSIAAFSWPHLYVWYPRMPAELVRYRLEQPD